MRIRNILGLVLGMTLVSACGDSPTEPTLAANQTAVMTASLSELNERGPYILFGGQVDSSESSLGLQYLGLHEFYLSMSISLEGSEKASVAYMTSGAAGITSDSTSVVRLKVLSDWKGVEPQNHRGVVYSDASEFYFRVYRYGRRPDGSLDIDNELPTQYYVRSAASGNASVTLELPRERSVRFVMVGQRRQSRCAGEDSLVVRAQSGLIQMIEGSVEDSGRDGSEPLLPMRIQAVTLRCQMYSSAAAVRLASANLIGGQERPARRSIERLNGKYYLRLE